ncbi:MAG: cell division protein FtsA [Deinococcota bacterium]|jgi:cell division protein FtsA|nr:cell division protein FtsA [Deinococcota bacterium]
MTDGRIIVGLDIGTTKICTVIGELASDGVLDIIGEGTVPSDGLRKGVVVNLERTIASVRQSIAAAERVAGVEVTSAWIGIAGSHLKAFNSHGMAAIRRGQEISRGDVERTVENARAIPLEANMEVIHVIPQEYVVDGQDGIKDPIGMSGVRLEVDVHIVAGAQGPLQNLKRCSRDAGAEVEGVVVQALASGLAVLDASERDVTTVLIDIGGGTTDVGVFRRGNLAHSAVIPLGGDHITQDISQLLRIPPDEAERVKKKYGVALPEQADREVALEVSHPNYTASLSTFELAQVIKPRVVEILDLVKRNIEQRMGAMELLAGNVVITGGASLMPGLDGLAAERFRLPVRTGKPLGVSGLVDVVASPAHATAVGLVRYGMRQQLPVPSKRALPGEGFSLPTWFGNIRNILKDFF